MATYYSSAWKPMTLGSTTYYEPIPVPMERAGNTGFAWFTATVPIGFTSGDILKLVPFQTSTPTTSPQIAGIRQTRIVLTNSGDVGGSVTANFGFASAGASVYGAALTTLQSATTLDVAIATIMAGPVLLANDDLQLVATAGTSTTLRTITGFVLPAMQAP